MPRSTTRWSSCTTFPRPRSSPTSQEQSDRPFADTFPLDAWPDVPTRVIAGRYDRCFPLEFVQRLARERLGIEPEVVNSGHLPALACPAELSALLLTQG